jgi:UDP-N-acetylglucosamine 2-epimerase (non-hydrolysing)
MAKKLKVMTIFGTRPEIIRLSRIFAKLDRYFDHIMVHAHQSFDYEMDGIFFEQMGIRKPDHSLSVKADTLGKQIANIIDQSEQVLIKEKPDCVLIMGDVNSALSSIIARRMRIPIFHMEAGNRAFDANIPEEANRMIIDHISDINLPYSENARQYLLREGVKPETIFVTGSPLREVYDYYKEKIDKSDILKQLDIEKGEYFIVSLHREENVDRDETLAKLVGTLNAVARNYKKSVVFGVHPRTKKRLEQLGAHLDPLVKLCKPFGYFDYMKLMKDSFCALSDSGTILEECSIVGFPAVQVRVSSERPEAYDEGAAILSGLDKDMVLQAIDIVTGQFAAGEKFKVPYNYQEPNVSGKIVRVIASQAKNILKKYH